VLIYQCDRSGCSGEHISLKSGTTDDSRNLRSVSGFVTFIGQVTGQSGSQ
jgi:hypothetical protein